MFAIAGQRHPGFFRAQPRDRTIALRRRQALFIDPFAIAVAIDANGREIEDLELLRQSIEPAAESGKNRIGGDARRDRDEENIRLCQRRCDGRIFLIVVRR